MHDKTRYTDKDAMLDLDRLKVAGEKYNAGEITLDEWLDSCCLILDRAKQRRLDYLWHGLYTLGDHNAIKRQTGGGR